MRVAFCRGGYGALSGVFHERFCAMVCGAFGVSIRVATCSSAAAAFACGCAPRCFGLRPRQRWRFLRACPRSRPFDFWAVSQEMGADFAMGPGLLHGFWRGLFAVSFSDLGKRRRVVVFRADLACETAQKSQAGLKVAHLDMCSGPVGAGRKHCDCRAVCVDAPSASRGMEGCSGNERSFFARLLRIVLRDALISRAISATESPCFLS